MRERLGAAVRRYEELGLADALTSHYDYPWACRVLSIILRVAYSKLPKNLQALVFRDTLSAFRLLPELWTLSLGRPNFTSSSSSSSSSDSDSDGSSLPHTENALVMGIYKT